MTIACPAFLTLPVLMGLLVIEFFASWGLVILLRRWLHHRDIMDIPNARSSHTVPVPRGGGLAMVVVSLSLWGMSFLVCASFPVVTLPMLAATFLLAVISWWDDHHNLSFAVRLLVHVMAIGIAVLTLPETARLFPQTLPLWCERGLIMLCAIWFINLYNFMDGINGALGMHTVTIAVGIALLAPQLEMAYLAILIIPAASGFLMLNWGHAKIFSGDIGSVTLGFMIGWLLLQMALAGLLIPAFILMFYPFADASLTLLRRLLNREKFWQPHRDHFYQKAVQSGWSHTQTVIIMALVNIVMIACAWLALQRPALALALAAAIVLSVLYVFEYRYQSRVPASSAVN